MAHAASGCLREIKQVLTLSGNALLLREIRENARYVCKHVCVCNSWSLYIASEALTEVDEVALPALSVYKGGEKSQSKIIGKNVYFFRVNVVSFFACCSNAWSICGVQTIKTLFFCGQWCFFVCCSLTNHQQVIFFWLMSSLVHCSNNKIYISNTLSYLSLVQESCWRMWCV